MPKDTFQPHIDAIKSGFITKTNVVGIRKALNNDARRAAGRSIGVTAPKATAEQINTACDLLDELQPVVTGDLHDTGMVQLKAKRYRKQLASVADIIETLQSFRLVGFEPIGRRGEYFTPIYRAEGANGQSFTFINVPWQSGGRGPEVLYR